MKRPGEELALFGEEPSAPAVGDAHGEPYGMGWGYIKLWRKSKNSAVFAHAGLWKLWSLCLMKAAHGEKEIVIDGLLEPVNIGPGQFITGRDSLYREYHQLHLPGRTPRRKRLPSPLSLFRWLLTLQHMQMLNIKSTNKFSIITITNWPRYQQHEQQMNNRRTTDDHKEEIIKNKERISSEKISGETSSLAESDPDQDLTDQSSGIQLASLLLELIRRRKPDFKSPDIQRWGREMDLLIRLDGRTPDRVEAVICWCQDDPFWHSNILSPSKLRKQFDQLELKMHSNSRKTPASSTPRPVNKEVWF
jgi:hypothetical protein